MAKVKAEQPEAGKLSQLEQPEETEEQPKAGGKPKSQKKPGLKQRMASYLSGIVTGSADNDPAAVTTYSVAGARSGLTQIWLLVLSAPMLIAVQGMCARIGDVTEKGLAEVLRENFPRPVVYFVNFLLLATTIIMIGADIIGVASAFELITHIKYVLWIVPVALVVWFAVLFTNFEKLELWIGILSLAFLSYFFAAVLARPNWGQVLKSLVVPTLQFNKTFILAAIGVVGATFTPPMFYWQAKEEVEEEKEASRGERMERGRKTIAQITPGFVFGIAMAIFIMISTATVLNANHKEVKTAADAAKALAPFVGAAAEYVYAIGIIGAGLVAIPVLSASAGYMVAETFYWKQSLSEKIDAAKGFYIVITLALFVGVEIALSGIDPVEAMFYSQALSTFVGPVLIGLVLILANRKKVMGKLTNGWFENVFGGLAMLLMIAGIIAFVIQQFTP